MHALVTTDTVGGVWTYTRELVAGLVRRGVRVTLVSFGEIPTAPQTQWLDGLRDVDFRPTGFRLEWMQEAEQDLSASTEYLQAVVDEVAPDVLHLNQFAYGALRSDVPRIVVAHSDVVSWWLAVHGCEPPDSPWMRWYRETVSRGLAGATTVVAPSRWMLESLRRDYGLQGAAAVIYNGRSPNQFNPHVSKEDYVLSVGRLWDAGKQVALLAAHEQALPVCIAGEQEHPDTALRKNGSAGRALSGNVQFKGKQSEAQLRHLYCRAAIYAATSCYEPFGLAPLEAALSRCAIVANDIPSLRELWGETALYFHRNDASDLARIIGRLAEDRDLRLTYANLAYYRARQRYSADRMAQEYLSLYHALVGAEVAA